jgi:hypothetical protein
VSVDGRGAGPEQLARLEAVCSEAGRDPDSLDKLVLLAFRERVLDSLDAYRDVAGRYGEAGFTDLVVQWPEPPFGGRESVLEAIAGEPR